MNSTSDFSISSRNELPIINSKEGLLVDARLLHEKLKSRRQFANWITDKIKDYGFEEGKDYLTNLLNRAGRGIGRGKLEYHLTLDMAKEICMVEKSEIGRNFRRYFIEAEKELRTKRLYAASATTTEISKKVKPVDINGRKMYDLNSTRIALGFSPNSNTSNIKKNYPGLIVKFNNRLHISEEYLKVMMSRAKTNALLAEAKQAKPVLPANFGQLPINFKGY